MRHRRAGRKLGRNRGHRRGLFRNLVASLLLHERIETTEAKGKELRAIGDRMISLGITGNLASRRRALAYVQDTKAVSRLFSKVAPAFKAASGASMTATSHLEGGYTRLIKTRVRYGDAAPMVIVELMRRTEDKKDLLPTKKTEAKVGESSSVDVAPTP